MRISTLGLAFAAVCTLVATPAREGRAGVGAGDARKDGGASAQQGQVADDGRADQLLKQMSDYLGSLKQFKVRSASIDEIVTTAGQKIQVVNDSNVAVRRPSALQSAQIESAEGLAFTYDGETMTLYCKMDNTYGTVKAPPTLDKALDELQSKYGIDASGADLLYSNAYNILTEQAKHGQYLGEETVDTVPAHHLAYRGQSVDWQIWIKDGPDPVPLRYVITSKTMKAQPQFTVQLSHWEPNANVTDATFKPEPPPGATRLESLPTKCGAKASASERK
jgi:hypothetical protein